MLRRWLLGTVSYATLTRHWRSTAVWHRYAELQRTLISSAAVREELAVLERIV